MLDPAATKENVDAILPQSSFDLRGLAEHVEKSSRMPVLVSSPDAIHRSNDKAETYEFLHRHRRDRTGVPARERVAHRVEAAALELGYPDHSRWCFKPVFSSGSRGFRVPRPTVDRAHQLLTSDPARRDAARGGVEAARRRTRPICS